VGVEVELADAVAALRDELLEAVSRGAGAEIAFVAGVIELEFAVELRRDVKAQTGFKAWVVTGEASGGVAHARTHRVKVALTPRAADGGDLLISGGSALREDPGHVGR
jgi:hypothetical protein